MGWNFELNEEADDSEKRLLILIKTDYYHSMSSSDEMWNTTCQDHM